MYILQVNKSKSIIIVKKFLPLSPHFLQPPPHGRGGLPAPIPLDVGHPEPSPRGRHHQGVVGDPREEKPDVAVEVEVDIV